MKTNMDNQQLPHMITRAPVTILMVQALHKFITPKLAEHGWLTAEEENQDLSCEILRNLLDLCHGGNSRSFILETLADNKTHLEMAEWISPIFLGHNPAPKDRDLLSFTDGVISFFHDLCWDHFVQLYTANLGSEVVANGDPSSYTLANPPIGTFPLLRLPVELRNMVYKEVLVVPNGGLVRSFATPALLRANKQLRDEAIPIFYGANHFEITIKRSPQDEVRAAIGGLPSVDMWVWRRFLHMWDDFNCFGTNCLRYVRQITLIYQISMDDGYSFGDGEFDKRLGFRFSSKPFKEDHDANHGEDSHRKTASDSSGQEVQSDLADPEAEAEGPEVEDSGEHSSGDENNGEVEQVPEDHPDPIGVFELNRGTVNWRSHCETHFFLFHRMCEYGNVSYRIKGSLEASGTGFPEDGDFPPHVVCSEHTPGE
ncbi:hypothetical protein FJTKL_09722 [Diaporthe vaccinii]|uniref:Uncharacterized protein n=1 Tax=Diaporthe vaccinii TaxID=105482 RepID=A0ABR4EMJ8_9PEZI